MRLLRRTATPAVAVPAPAPGFRSVFTGRVTSVHRLTGGYRMARLIVDHGVPVYAVLTAQKAETYADLLTPGSTVIALGRVRGKDPDNPNAPLTFDVRTMQAGSPR